MNAEETVAGSREPVSPEGSLASEHRTVLDGPSLAEWVGLLAILGSFVIVVVYLCELRSEEFFTTNWDLGVNQQMLWTTAHGSLLYEAGDYEIYGVHSFLQLHSTYLALLIVPIYSAAPIPETLFAVQATAFAASAVPLYLIGRSIIRSKPLLYGAVLIYLINFAVLSALFYDYHWEAFIPLEILWFFLLIQRGRFTLSLVPLLAGMLTLEVFPFLAGGVILFFLLEHMSARKWTWEKILKDRELRVLAALLVVAGLAYAALRVIQYLVIPSLLGVSGSTGGAASSITSSFAFSATLTTLNHAALYWVLILACLGFLPLLSPKHLILLLPWFIESTFFTPFFASGFGNQYALLAVTGVSVAFVFGLGSLESSRFSSRFQLGTALSLVAATLAITVFTVTGEGSRTLLTGPVAAPVWAALIGGPLVALVLTCVGQRSSVGKSAVRAHPRIRSIRQRNASLLLGLLTILIVFNIAMSPVNTTNFEATQWPGYSFQWSENPMESQMAWVTHYIPSNAVVLASDNLFPYVANNRNAYAIPWFAISASSPVPYFPFTPTDVPQFILMDTSQLQFVPPFLLADTLNGSLYGLVAYVYTTEFPGTVYLFEEGYNQAALGRDIETPPTTYFFSSANLSLGPAGRIEDFPTANFGTAIVSQNVTLPQQDRAIWYGPYITLVPGAYHLVFNLTGSAKDASEPLVELDAGIYFPGASENLTYSTVDASQLTPTGWTNLEYNITLDKPYPSVELRGYLEFTGGVPNGMVALNYIEVSRA